MKYVLIALTVLMFNNSYAQKKKVLRKEVSELQNKNEQLKDSIYKLNLKLSELEFEIKLLESNKTEEASKTVEENKNTLVTSGDSIAYIIQQFLEADTWQDRLNYVLEQDNVREIFMEKYKTPGTYKTTYLNYTPIKSLDIDIPNETARMIVLDNYNFYVFRNGTDYFIDWFATTGYNDVPLGIFRKESSDEVGRYKVVVKLNNLYRHNYEKAKDTHWALTISTIKNEKVLYTYVRKDSNAGKFLYEYLKDGGTHPFIVDLKFDKSKEKTGKVALITNVIAYGWSYY